MYARLVKLIIQPRSVSQYRTMTTVNKINFNTKHLQKGDPEPPFNGKLRIYNMRYCPYAQRTVLALNAKNIDYEVVNINLMNKPEWLTKKSIFGKVPALEITDGLTICESLVTVDYLDDVYPQRPLHSKDPVQKALDKIIVEYTGRIHTAFYKSIRAVEPLNAEDIASYNKGLELVQSELASRGTKFFGGEQPTYPDYMIWPWFERVITMSSVFPDLKIDAAKFPLLIKYCDHMMVDPAVAIYTVPADILEKVIEGYKPGNTPNYDLMLEE